MAYTSPRTWVAGETVTAALLNTHLRDNLIALKDPPTDSYNVNEASDYNTTSTTFVDIDATDLALTITTTGGDVLVGFSGSIEENTGALEFVYLDVAVDGTRRGGDDGILMIGNTVSTEPQVMSFVYLVTGLSAGSHTFKLQWKVSAGGDATMWAGAGTSEKDVHPQFWAREVS